MRKRLLPLCCLALASACLVAAARPVTSTEPLYGVWKLRAQKNSGIRAETMTISPTPTGMKFSYQVTLETGGEIAFHFVCRPNGPACRTITTKSPSDVADNGESSVHVRRISRTEFEVNSVEGDTVLKHHLTISADGKLLTDEDLSNPSADKTVNYFDRAS